MNTPLLTVENCRFYRGDHAIFDDVSMRFQTGKITAVMGPSGTGKTTLLRLIAGQLKPDQGTIRFQGQDIATMSAQNLQQYRKSLGMLFQNGALFTDMSVFDNVAFPLREHTSLSAELIRDVVLMKLQAVGLRGSIDKMPAELSGGMARRVALARAIALDPILTLYDEPFAGQDPILMAVIQRLIKQLNQTLGHTSILVSHDVEETIAIADYLYVLAGGKVIAEGEPKAVFANPDAGVQQFMRGLPDGPVAFEYPAPSLAVDLNLAGQTRDR